MMTPWWRAGRERWRCCCGFGIWQWMWVGGVQAGRRSSRAGAFGACGEVGWQGGVLGGVCARRVVVRGLAATGGDACGRNQQWSRCRSHCLQWMQ